MKASDQTAARAGKSATGRYLQRSRPAFVLFLGAVGALLWLNDKAERDEQQASSLAHELNQPLAAITGYNTGMLNEIRADTMAPQEIATTLEKLGRPARRAGDVIRRIDDFVRRREPRRERCDIGTVIDDAVGLVEADARQHGIRIDRDDAAALPPTLGDPVLLGQVLVNLLRNAIGTMRDAPRQRRVLGISATAAADAGHIAVSDSGCGIPAERVRRIFEPFFTTKSEGMGSVTDCR